MKFFAVIVITILVTHVKATPVFNYKTGHYLKKSDIKLEYFQEDTLMTLSATQKNKRSVESIVDEPKMSEVNATVESGYNVTGSYTSYISSPCHYSRLKQIIEAPAELTSDLAVKLQSWVRACEPELSRFQTSALLALLNYTLVNYPLHQNSKLQSITFTYDENYLKARGILALKDSKKRPLVIFRNGVYGDAKESNVSRNFIMQVFDESPFHMLFLGNLTGEEFIKDNGILAMGGFDEGRQFHEIIKQLVSENSPYKDLIEDIHIIGVSLGANGALFSSLYNSYLPEDATRVKSVTALCPVVNLENSLNNVFSDSPIGKIYSFITYKLLKDVFKFVPVLSELLNDGDNWSQDEITNAVKEGAVRYYRERTHKTPWDYAPFEGRRIQTEADFWELNDFTKYAELVQTPTLVVHAKDDFIVPSEKNSKLLFNKLQNNKTHVGVVEVQNGSHCAFNIANGWPTLSTLMREFILKHSSYQRDDGPIKSPISYVKAPKKSTVLVFARYDWVIEKDKSHARLKVKYLNKNGRDEQAQPTCRNQDHRFANSTFCYASKDYDVKLSSFQNLNLRAPASDLEANVMSRWLNTHVTPVLENGTIPYGTTEYPTHFISQGVFDY